MAAALVLMRPPILSGKRYGAPSVFTPENLLREARRQKGLGETTVPDVCVLDPDGDVALIRTSIALRTVAPSTASWAVPSAPHFAVLVAEELFVSGCRLLVSVTSAGQIVPDREPPYFVLI